MKKYKVNFAIILLCILLSACMSKYGRGTYDLYLIPDGYEGNITVYYNVKDAPLLLKEDRYDVIPINDKGIFETSNPMYDYGEVIDKYYYIDINNNRTMIDKPCVHIIGTGGTSDGFGNETSYTQIKITKTNCGQQFMLEG